MNRMVLAATVALPRSVAPGDWLGRLGALVGMAKWSRHAKAAAPTGLAVAATETNSAGSPRMGQATGIEWCDHTYNPWMGCTKVSPACDHCYAEAQEDTRYGRVEWGGPRRRTSAATRRAPYRWDREAAAAGERRRVSR
jgi:hypothetical protein